MIYTAPVKSKITLFSLLVLFATPSFAIQSKRILFIGDSHVAGPFGKTLDKLLRTQTNTTVETYGVCGSIGTYFFKGTPTHCGFFYHHQDGSIESGDQQKKNAPLIKDLMQTLNPQLVIIELGSNYATGFKPEFPAKDMRKLALEATKQGAKCIWISMPDTRKFRSEQPTILQATHQAIDSLCTFIDSTLLTHYPDHGGDGLHYEDASLRDQAISWAKESFYQIQKTNLSK